MWDGLGRPVLKSDLLRLVPLPPTCVARAEVVDRYLMMLVKGGMYTDSDTAPLSDPNLWGTHAHTLTPPSLSALQRAMRHIDPASREYRSQSDIDEDFASNPITDSSRGINNPRISMVISIEYDVNHPRQDPRFGYTRDLQIVQWTFMVSRVVARPREVEGKNADVLGRQNHSTRSSWMYWNERRTRS